MNSRIINPVRSPALTLAEVKPSLSLVAVGIPSEDMGQGVGRASSAETGQSSSAAVASPSRASLPGSRASSSPPGGCPRHRAFAACGEGAGAATRRASPDDSIAGSSSIGDFSRHGFSTWAGLRDVKRFDGGACDGGHGHELLARPIKAGRPRGLFYVRIKGARHASSQARLRRRKPRYCFQACSLPTRRLSADAANRPARCSAHCASPRQWSAA